MTPSVRLLKRAIDVFSASAGLVLTAPLFPLIAAAIYIESPGPVLFFQRRAGTLKGVQEKDGTSQPVFEEFRMRKFRTMRPDAEKLTGPVLASEDDPRITKVGKFLRRTRLDELPQLLNVLLGEMSLVGPRPERPELIADLAAAIPFFEERMRDVKPGITGLAQVSLGYTGKASEGSEVMQHLRDLTNPFDLEEAEGALADDMRLKLLFDLAYAASLESLGAFVRMEAMVIFSTPKVMILGQGR